MDSSDLWQAAVAEVRAQMTEAAYWTYLHEVTLIGVSDQIFTIGVKGALLDWCDTHLRVALEHSLSKLANAPQQVKFVAANESAAILQPLSDAVVPLSRLADWAQLGIPPQFLDATLETLDWSVPALTQPGLRDYVDRQMDYLVGGFGLVLIGPTGIGKTHLVVGLAKRAAEEGWSVAFIDMASFLKRLRQASDLVRLGQPPEGDLHLIDDLAGVDLLVLDDLQASDLTAWSQARVYELVGLRWAAKRPILATSNLGLDELAHPKGRLGHDSTMLSRLAGAAIVIELRGDDYRARLKQMRVTAIRQRAGE